MPDIYERLASHLMFSGYAQGDLEAMGLTFRKGKGVHDLQAARQKGLRAGRGKTEHELSMMALYVKDVVKPAPR